MENLMEIEETHRQYYVHFCIDVHAYILIPNSVQLKVNNPFVRICGCYISEKPPLNPSVIPKYVTVLFNNTPFSQKCILNEI